MTVRILTEATETTEARVEINTVTSAVSVLNTVTDIV